MAAVSGAVLLCWSRAAGVAPVDRVFDQSIRAALDDVARGKFEREPVPAFKLKGMK